MEKRREELEQTKRDEVRKIASGLGVKNVSKYTKGQLIDMILEAEEPVKEEPEKNQEEEKAPCRVFYVRGNAKEIETREKKGKEFYAENLERGDRIIYRKDGRLNSGKVRMISESNASCTVINYDGFIESVKLSEVEFYCFNFVGGQKVPARSVPVKLFNELKSRPESREERRNEKYNNPERSERSNQEKSRTHREEKGIREKNNGRVCAV